MYFIKTCEKSRICNFKEHMEYIFGCNSFEKTHFSEIQFSIFGMWICLYILIFGCGMKIFYYMVLLVHYIIS